MAFERHVGPRGTCERCGREDVELVSLMHRGRLMRVGMDCYQRLVREARLQMVESRRYRRASGRFG